MSESLNFTHDNCQEALRAMRLAGKFILDVVTGRFIWQALDEKINDSLRSFDEAIDSELGLGREYGNQTTDLS